MLGCAAEETTAVKGVVRGVVVNDDELAKMVGEGEVAGLAELVEEIGEVEDATEESVDGELFIGMLDDGELDGAGDEGEAAKLLEEAAEAG